MYDCCSAYLLKACSANLWVGRPTVVSHSGQLNCHPRPWPRPDLTFVAFYQRAEPPLINGSWFIFDGSACSKCHCRTFVSRAEAHHLSAEKNEESNGGHWVKFWAQILWPPKSLSLGGQCKHVAWWVFVDKRNDHDEMELGQLRSDLTSSVIQ